MLETSFTLDIFTSGFKRRILEVNEVTCRHRESRLNVKKESTFVSFIDFPTFVSLLRFLQFNLTLRHSELSINHENFLKKLIKSIITPKSPNVFPNFSAQSTND